MYVQAIYVSKRRLETRESEILRRLETRGKRFNKYDLSAKRRYSILIAIGSIGMTGLKSLTTGLPV